MKRRCTIFHAWVGLCGFNKKCAEKRYVEHEFLHTVGSTSHVLAPVRPGSEMSTHYFSCSAGPGAVSIKSVLRHYSKLVFLRLVRSTDYVLHSGASEARNVDALYFMLRWDWYGFHKKHTRIRYAELVSLHAV